MLLFTPTCYQFLMVSDLVFFYFRSVFVIPCPPLYGFILVFFTPRGHPIGMGNNFETLHLRSVFASTKKNIFFIKCLCLGVIAILSGYLVSQRLFICDLFFWHFGFFSESRLSCVGVFAIRN